MKVLTVIIAIFSFVCLLNWIGSEQI